MTALLLALVVVLKVASGGVGGALAALTDLVSQAAAALARADASRWAPPETVPRLPDLTRPAPVLPRHLGHYEDPFADDQREDVAVTTDQTAGLVPGQYEQPVGYAALTPRTVR